MVLNNLFKNFKYPKKSILGFKVLSSIESSISAYIILFISSIFLAYFGVKEREINAVILFNIIAYASLLILILNLFLKRHEIKKNHFIILNFPLFLFLPFFGYKLILNLYFLLRLIQF